MQKNNENKDIKPPENAQVVEEKRFNKPKSPKLNKKREKIDPNKIMVYLAVAATFGNILYGAYYVVDRQFERAYEQKKELKKEEEAKNQRAYTMLDNLIKLQLRDAELVEKYVISIENSFIDARNVCLDKTNNSIKDYKLKHLKKDIDTNIENIVELKPKYMSDFGMHLIKDAVNYNEKMEKISNDLLNCTPELISEEFPTILRDIRNKFENSMIHYINDSRQKLKDHM